MSSPSSGATKAKKRVTTTRVHITRAPSASEIARNLKHFETWSSHQACEQISYYDLPVDLKDEVTQVFDVTGRLPRSWVDKTSSKYRALSQFTTPAFLQFLREAYKTCPSLFREQDDQLTQNDLAELHIELIKVFSSWTCLQKMRKSKEKWSEADFAGKVYNPLRSHAILESTHRMQCTLSLPQPVLHEKMGTEAVRVLNAKTVIPDCSIFIPAANIRTLSHSIKSPFNVLKGHASVKKRGNASKGTSFRYQATPCAQPPDTPGFEFISSVWEDKKPTHQMLEDAYRQNRMAAAAAARHLHSLQIQSPLFGLVWANGTVRAHVDWCKNEEGKPPVVFSAPYPGSAEDSESDDDDEPRDIFHEWQLDKPGDILQVYFLVKNIDKWTTGKFSERVITGIHNLVTAIVHEKKEYKPWKRVGELSVLSGLRKENIISISASSSSTPPKPKRRRHRPS